MSDNIEFIYQPYENNEALPIAFVDYSEAKKEIEEADQNCHIETIELHGKLPGASDQQLDNCQICKGAKGGVPGNENVIDNVVMCDYCHAAKIKSDQQKQELLDRIGRLEALLKRYRNEVPLGHQPQMIAHLVDQELSRNGLKSNS